MIFYFIFLRSSVLFISVFVLFTFYFYVLTCRLVRASENNKGKCMLLCSANCVPLVQPLPIFFFFISVCSWKADGIVVVVVMFSRSPIRSPLHYPQNVLCYLILNLATPSCSLVFSSALLLSCISPCRYSSRHISGQGVCLFITFASFISASFPPMLISSSPLLSLSVSPTFSTRPLISLSSPCLASGEIAPWSSAPGRREQHFGIALKLSCPGLVEMRVTAVMTLVACAW